MATSDTDKSPTKRIENITEEKVPKSHSNKVIKNVLSLVNKSSLSKALLLDIDLNETDEFQTGCGKNVVLPNLSLRPKRKRPKSKKSIASFKSDHIKKEKLSETTVEREVETASREVTSDTKLDSNTCGIQREATVKNCPDEDTCEGSQQTCPSCQQTLFSSQMAAHVSECLKQKFSLVGSKTGIQDYQAQIEMKRKHVKFYLCQICQKDISRMNSACRTQHVNTCIDLSEKKSRKKEEKKQLLSKARSAILDCPICGKSIKTAQARKTHMKKCAVAQSVTTDRLLELVKLQEEERNLELEAGVVPSSLRSLKMKSITSRLGKKRDRKAIPKNQYDEETQLALALSTSIADQQKIHQAVITGQDVNYPGKKSRHRKNHTEEVPIVLRLSKEEARQRIADKVTQLLLPITPQNSQENCPATPPGGSKLVESDITVQCDIFRSSLQQTHLWSRAGLPETDSRNKEFYVTALMPIVSMTTVKAGSRLKRMSVIPGRRNSEELEREILQKQLTAANENLHRNLHFSQTQSIQPEHISPLPPVTQTAAILAEMAAEADENKSQMETSATQPSNNLHCSGFCPEVPLIIPEIYELPCLASLQKSFLMLVDFPQDSDVKITAKDKEIYAHKIFLRLRCPQLLEELSTDCQTIDLSVFRSEVVVSVLKYIYGGDVTMYPGMLHDVCQLANRLKLTELETICRAVIKSNLEQPVEKEIEVPQLDILENLLSESEREDDDDVEEHSDGGEVKGQEDVEEDDWREMLYTQREKNRKQSLTESDFNSGVAHCDLLEPIEDFPGSRSNNYTDKIQLEADAPKPKGDNLLMLMAESQSVEDMAISEIEDDVPLLQIIERRSSTDSQSSKVNRPMSVTESKIQTMIKNITGEKLKNSATQSNVHVSLSDQHISPGADVKETRHRKNLMLSVKSATASSSSLDLSSDLFQSDEELFSEGENVQCPENIGFDVSTDNSDKELDLVAPMSDFNLLAKKQPFTGESSMENPICLSSDDEGILNIDIPYVQEQKKENVNNLISFGKMQPISDKDIVTDYKSANKTCNNCDPIPETKQVKKTKLFKFVKLNGKNMRHVQEVASLGSAPSTADSTEIADACQDDLTVNITEEGTTAKMDRNVALVKSKRQLSCASPNSENFAKTSNMVAKRYKMSIPNNDHGKTMSHYCSMNKHDLLYILPVEKHPRSTFMSVTPLSPSNKDSNEIRDEVDIATPIKNLDTILSRSSQKLEACEILPVPTLDVNSEQIGSDPVTLDSSRSSKVKETAVVLNSHSDSDIEIVSDNLEENNNDYPESPRFGTKSQLSQKSVQKVHDISDLDDGCVTKIIVWEGFDDDGFNNDADGFNNDADGFYNDADGFNNDSACKEVELLEQISTNQSKFKTPTMSESAKKKRRKKEWVPPSPFTPMPDYDKMSTPQLKDQLSKVGLRPACKKRMKNMMAQIYHETHQYETDSDCEIGPEKVNKNTQIHEVEIKSKLDLKTNLKKSKASTKAVASSKAPIKAVTSSKAKSKEWTQPPFFPTSPVKHCNVPLDDSSDNQPSSSQSSDFSDLPEESFMTVMEDEDIGNEGDSQKCTKPDLFKKLSEFIRNDEQIYTKVLSYNPLEIDVLKNKLNESGLKCSMDKLLEYLDEKCINFTMKNNRKPRKQRRKPKQRKTKTAVDI